MTSEKQCGRCGQSITGRSPLSLYCSDYCRKKAYKARRRGRLTRQCQQCGQTYKAKIARSKFCSHACRERAYEAREGEKRQLRRRRRKGTSVECARCGRFYVTQYADRSRYCSKRCRNAASEDRLKDTRPPVEPTPETAVPCQQCEKLFLTRRPGYDKFCSDTCRIVYHQTRHKAERAEKRQERPEPVIPTEERSKTLRNQGKQDTADGRLSLLAAYHQYLRQLERQERSPDTIKNIRNRLEPFCEANVNLLLTQVTEDLLWDWFEPFRDKERYAVETANSYKQTFKTFFNWCVKQGWIQKSPATELHRKDGKRKRKHPSTGTLYRLMHTAERLAEEGDPRHIRNFAILLFAIETAARRGEIANLLIDDLDLEKCEATSEGKTGEVFLSFTETCAEVMRRWLEVRPRGKHDRVWVSLRKEDYGNPLTIWGITAALVSISEAAGLDKVYRPHAFRHWNGQTYVDQFNARVAAEKLNHKSTDVVLKYYYHVDREKVKAVTKIASPTSFLNIAQKGNKEETDENSD